MWVTTAVLATLLGFIIGIWADNFEKLQLVPLLIVTPLTFLGGSFYSIKMLPEVWQKITLFNPVVYLISGFRWSFYGVADVAVWISLAMTGDFGWITDEASELTLGGQALYVPELQTDADFGPFLRIDLMPDLPV